MIYRTLTSILHNYQELNEAEFRKYAIKKHDIAEDNEYISGDKMAILIHILRAWVLSSLDSSELETMLKIYENNGYERLLEIAKETYKINPSMIKHETREYILLLMLNPHLFGEFQINE